MWSSRISSEPATSETVRLILGRERNVGKTGVSVAQVAYVVRAGAIDSKASWEKTSAALLYIKTAVKRFDYEGFMLGRVVTTNPPFCEEPFLPHVIEIESPIFGELRCEHRELSRSK